MARRRYQPLMIVGTGSHVGKSVLVAGLCRLFRRQGIDVAPFKAQNMALNSGITPEGGEMGRATIAQAEAAGIPPHVDMNPILLKPTTDLGSQVIVDGKVLGNYKGVEYYRLKPRLARRVGAAFERLSQRHELIVMEGAGSCAEVNLKKHDLVNLPMAKRAGARVALVADIDAGGVFGQVVGTMGLLTPTERALLAGVIINKFRGDPDLFQDGIAFLEKKTRLPVLGLLPYFRDIELPQEDGVVLERGGARDGRCMGLRVGAVRLARISNFTDLDAVAAEDGVELTWVERPEELAGLDLVILPGTKSTLAALEGLKKTGLFEGLRAFYRLGGRVLGLCGGYQLLGRRIADPLGVDGSGGEEEGLALLPVETEMAPIKTTTQARAVCAPDLPFAVPGEVAGYEIHMGETRPLERPRPAFRLTARLDQAVSAEDGQVSPEGRAVGTYLHGILDNDALRAGVLSWAAGQGDPRPPLDYAGYKDKQYDLLADLLEQHLNVAPLLNRLA